MAKGPDFMRSHVDSKPALNPSGFKGDQWNSVLEFQGHLQPCAPLVTTLEWVQNHCPESPVPTEPSKNTPRTRQTPCIPSENSMAPANTRAANSPTLNPAAATQFSMTCGDRAEHEAEPSARVQSQGCPWELAGQLSVTMSRF